MGHFSVSVMRSDGSSARFEFQPGRITVGREIGEIATLDPTVVDPHAELIFDGHILQYLDAGSSSGSFSANGQRLSGPIALQVGTTILFGTCKLIVEEIHVAASPAAQIASQSGLPNPHSQSPVASAAQGSPAYGIAEPSPQLSPYEGQTHNVPGTGVIQSFLFHMRQCFHLYKKHYVSGVLTVGIITLPAALINSLLTFIPVVGAVLSIVVGLVQFLVTPFAIGAVGRWAISTAAGQELQWKSAWKKALKAPLQEWLNIFVAQLVTMVGAIFLIVPGIILGMFALPAYLLENKRFVAINLRSAELVLKDAWGLIGLGILTFLAFIPVFVVTSLLVAVVSLLPFVGTPLGALLSACLSVFVGPFISLVWAKVYLGAVTRFEGHDPVRTHGAVIQSWSTP